MLFVQIVMVPFKFNVFPCAIGRHIAGAKLMHPSKVNSNLKFLIKLFLY